MKQKRNKEKLRIKRMHANMKSRRKRVSYDLTMKGWVNEKT